jgi:hypothetical protein
LFSGTWGLARTAEAGSRAGTGGISISPAPRLPREGREDRPDLVDPDLVRPVPVLPRLPVLALPVGADSGAAATPQTSQ